MNNHLILFDGVCNLCNGTVKFIIKRDKKAVFQFASLQSNYAKKTLSNFIYDDMPDSVILIKNDKIYVKSEAAFEILKELSLPWKTLLFFKIFPIGVTDVIYDLIAKYRYKIFGKKDHCPIPDKSISNRFIND